MRPVDVLYLVEHTSREMDVACAVKVLAERRHGLNVEIRNIYLHAQQSLRELDPLVVAHPFFYYATGALGVEDYIARWPDALHFNVAWEQLHYKAHWQVKRPSDDFARTQVIHHAWGRFYQDYLTGFGVPEQNIRLNGQPAYQLYLDPYRRHYRTRESLAALYGLDPAKVWVFVPENYRWAFIGGKAKLFSKLGGNPQEIDALRDFSRQSLRLLLSCCNALAQEPGVEIIFRTRPAVNSEIMLDFFGQHVGQSAPRLHFIKEGSVREWILASDKVVSSYSTSLIEAAVAGKDVFMFEPVPFPSALHCAWYDLAPKITDAAQFAERCLGAGSQAGGTPLHRWAHAELLSTGDAISNLCDLLQEMKALSQARRVSPASPGPRQLGPLPPADRTYFNPQTHEADVFESEDAARWIDAWRGTLAGADAPAPSAAPVLNRALRGDDLQGPEWAGLASSFPALQDFRLGSSRGGAGQGSRAGGLLRRMLDGFGKAAGATAGPGWQEPELLAACGILAGLFPRLQRGMRVLALGGGSELLKAHLEELGVELVPLGFSELLAQAERPQEALVGCDHAIAACGLEDVDAAKKRSVLVEVARRLGAGGVLGLSFAFGADVGAGQAGPRNQLRNVADIRRQFLCCPQYELLGNEAFMGYGQDAAPCVGVVFLRRKGPQGASGDGAGGIDDKPQGRKTLGKAKVPEHWSVNSWEEKAKENPLYAVMTMPQMADAGAEDFSEAHLQLFFEKGRKLVEAWVLPSLEAAPAQGLVVEYGCGAGRMLNALVERGVACAGIDISPTMLEHCGRLVPGVSALAGLSDEGSVSMPDGCARLVYSYAVVQHIDRLSAYAKAVAEMCRLLAPGGKLVLQVNCQDYALACDGALGRTESHEDYSVHYAPGASKGSIHKNSTWSGVYIGRDELLEMLLRCGVAVDCDLPFNTTKPRARVFFGTKIR